MAATIFGGRKPSSKLTLKTKWYYSCGYPDCSQSYKQLKKLVTDKNFEKLLNFEVTDVYMAYVSDRNFGQKNISE